MMTRQQANAKERAEQKLIQRGIALRKSNPLVEDVYQRAFFEGTAAANRFAVKDCYAAAVLALHELEGYGGKRNVRFLRRMDYYLTSKLSTEELIDEALEKAGVRVDFREPFPEDRIQEAER